MNTTDTNRWTLLLAAPAVAGLLYVAGCDDGTEVGDDDVEVTGVETGDTLDVEDEMADPVDPVDDAAEPAAATTGGMMDRAADAAGGMAAGMKDRLTGMADELETSVEGAMGDAEGETADALSQAKDLVARIKTAVSEGDMGELGGHVRQLQGMKADLPQDVQNVIERMAAAVPGVSQMGGDLGGAAEGILGGGN